jgi:predicted nuclease of predicted toxin-antitoxin system
MLNALVDTQLPPKLARFLQTKGWDVIHTIDFPDGHLMADIAIREIAISQNRIVITKDIDFFDLYLAKGIPPRVLLLKFGNISNRDLIIQFDANYKGLLLLFETGAEFLFFGYEGIVQY